ncbi:hypothetical protein H2199_007483 [Coniosporium tulheliwenetii]|uniref:Uncharacterized protein n=1 Tax=Coniosporium tulheliwenetii TaxID=3383036 RepID=A0ACC2YPA6_9PEZI|nr:hypothetical protein H2199_007483 [Cladosporium sp. JES 115]
MSSMEASVLTALRHREVAAMGKEGSDLADSGVRGEGDSKSDMIRLPWSRNTRSSWVLSVGCVMVIITCPFLVHMTWIALEYFDSSLSRAIGTMLEMGPVPFFIEYTAVPTKQEILGYGLWLVFQGTLYAYLPGRSKGRPTPAGHVLDYHTNGFLAWLITTSLFIAGIFFNVIDPTILVNHWGGLVTILNVYGFILATVAYLKARFASSHPKDNVHLGNFWYDFFMGVELNPRFGQDWDWKLFHNGRPGIIAWTLIDISYTMYQYRTFGYVTKSILIVDILQTFYVVDFFFHESWYLWTIDIVLDHFGFNLAWGSAAWLPTIYTLQVQYLARHPVEWSTLSAAAILLTGCAGYVLFRSVNNQKDLARRTEGDCTIWERRHRSFAASWWGIARHVNYVGDLMLSYAACATCGFQHLLPWTYAIFMTILLVHRCLRDEARLSAKYGDGWKEYCKAVPYRLIPGIW